MNRTKRNKPKKKKKNSGKKKASKFENRPGKVKQSPNKLPVEPTSSAENGDSQIHLKKAKKRKHSIQGENPHAEKANGHDGIPQKKKKKVTWGENTSKVIPKTGDPSESEHSKTCSTPKILTATESFLSILALTDTVQETGNGSKAFDGKITAFDKRAARKAKKLEKRARDKQAKALLKNSEPSRVKALESIEDRNIQNRKLKDKNVKLVGNQEKMDAKRPRLDEKSAVHPAKKRTPTISPNREIVPGYKLKDLSEKQIETFLRLKDLRKYDKVSSPKLLLQNFANYSSMKLDNDDRTPLTLSDVQHFLIYTLHGQHSTGNLPTWVSLKNAKKLDKNVCIVVDGVSLSDYVNNEDHLPNLSSFKYQLEVVTPYAYGGDFVTEFLHVPLTDNQRLKLKRKLGSLKEACIAGEAFETLQRIYPSGTFRTRKKNDKSGSTGPQENSKDAVPASDPAPVPESDPAPVPNFSDPNVLIFPPSEDKFPRTELLLRSWDLIKERVPVPFAQGLTAQKYKGFVQTKDTYDEVTDQSPIWALDCEMCLTKAGQELTRISIINENFEVVYESMVKPYNPIVNYLTQYSGITKQDLENVWTRIEDVHEDLRDLLPSDVILAGHSIGCDLLAMKMFHPYVIDTSCIFNLSGVRPQKTKLKTLMAELLYERIQEGGKHGHDSVEDAAACLKLIKAKLSRSLEWGDAVLGGKRSEEDSVFSQQMILKRDKEGRKPTIYPVAAKSIIRCGPRAHQTSVQHGAYGTQPQEPRKHRVYSEPEPVFFPRNTVSYDRSTYSKPIITHLAARDFKNLLFVGDEKFVSAGQELVKSKFKVNLPESRVQFSVQPNRDALKYGFANAPKNGISVLRLSPDEESDSKTRILQADKLIGKALKELKQHNSLVTILLAGRQADDENDTELYANHGLLMMKIIKPVYVPLTIEDISETCS